MLRCEACGGLAGGGHRVDAEGCSGPYRSADVVPAFQLAAAEARAEQQERFKWEANKRAEAAEGRATKAEQERDAARRSFGKAVDEAGRYWMALRFYAVEENWSPRRADRTPPPRITSLVEDDCGDRARAALERPDEGLLRSGVIVRCERVGCPAPRAEDICPVCGRKGDPS